MARPRRPFRFAADLSAVVDGPTLTERARRAEADGYDALVLGDHLLDQLAAIPALATIAAATERVRIGTFVLNNDLRHPAVLAQELATLDVLSGGRLEVGIGAGWNRAEYTAAGLTFDPPGVRIERLGEAVAVLKGLFADDAFSFDGRHYRIEGMDGRPKPLQRPSPPFLIGGGGRRVLTLAARQADIVGLAPRASADVPAIAEFLAPATDEKVGWVRDAAADRFDGLRLDVYPALGPLTITDRARTRAAEVADRVAHRTGVTVSADDVLASPFSLIGSVDELAEKLLEMRERFAIDSVTVFDAETFAPVVERLRGR